MQVELPTILANKKLIFLVWEIHGYISSSLWCSKSVWILRFSWTCFQLPFYLTYIKSLQYIFLQKFQKMAIETVLFICRRRLKIDNSEERKFQVAWKRLVFWKILLYLVQSNSREVHKLLMLKNFEFKQISWQNFCYTRSHHLIHLIWPKNFIY